MRRIRLVRSCRAAALHGAAALTLAACAVGPDWSVPKSWSPDTWFASGAPHPAVPSEPAAAPIDTEWWKGFNDPTLTGLVRRVAAQNLDVRSAGFRLAQSRAQRGVTVASQFFQANGNGSYTREKQSTRGVIGLVGGSSGTEAGSTSASTGGLAGGTTGGTVSGAPGSTANGLGGRQSGIPAGGIGGGGSGGGASAIGSPFDLWQYGFDASWELDVWGRVRRSVEAADAQLEASTEDRRDTLLSVTSEVARDYLQLRGTQEQLRVTRANLRTAQESLQVTRSRVRSGLAPDLDVENATAQVEETAASLPQLEQQEEQGMNALALLLGAPPGALRAELAQPRPIPPVPPRVPLGLPSELARRRPDVRRAEAQLHSAIANIGVAEADLFPRITLSGSLALQSLQFKDLGSWAARTYALGPSISLPIFQGGSLRATLDLRRQAQQEAAITYQRAVLQAFHDVDNALIAFNAEQRRREGLRRQVDADRRALDVARSRYRSGLTDFLNVLTAERSLLAAEQSLATNASTIGTNLVQLYKALGGGWEAEYPRDEAVAARAAQPG